MARSLKMLVIAVVGILFLSSMCFAVQSRIIWGANILRDDWMVAFIGENEGRWIYSNNGQAYFIVTKENPDSILFCANVSTEGLNHAVSGEVMPYNIDFKIDDEIWWSASPRIVSQLYGAAGYFLDLSGLDTGEHFMEAIITGQGSNSGNTGYATATLVMADLDESNRTVTGSTAGSIYPLNLGFTPFDGHGLAYIGVEWSSMSGMSMPSNLYYDSACTQMVDGGTQLSWTKEKLWGVNDTNKPTTLYYKKPTTGMGGVSFKVKLAFKEGTSPSSNMIVRNVNFQ